jgi:hypothetical protein
MTGSLRGQLSDYLVLRRALGYRMARPEKLLAQFLDHLERLEESMVTVTGALDWARLPANGGSNWWAYPDTAAGNLDDREDVHPGAGERDGLDEVRRQQRLGLRAQEIRPRRGGPIGCGIDPGLAQDLPDSRRGDLDAEGEQLAVHAPVAPRRVVRHQAQHQRADRAYSSRSARRRGRDMTAWRAATRSRR